MASGITTAQQLQDVLDAIHDNISQMDVYQGLSELGSLRLCWNDISRTATIFKRINEEEEREEVVCTFNPENIVIGTDTFQGKMLKNIVHNATTTVTRSNDVGLGGYVGLKTLIRNICAALGVNLAPSFDEINPTIYGELVNIVKKYYGDSLQNNAPYGIARKDTTSGGTTTTTYNSYIPVMIIVDIAIYLNGLGVFSVNKDKLYIDGLPNVLYPNGGSSVSIPDYFDTNYARKVSDIYSTNNLQQFFKDCNDVIITGGSISQGGVTITRKTAFDTLLHALRSSFENEMNSNNILFLCYYNSLSMRIYEFPASCTIITNLTNDFAYSNGYEKLTINNFSEDYFVKEYTASLTDISTLETNTIKKVTEVLKESIKELSNFSSNTGYYCTNINYKYYIKYYSNFYYNSSSNYYYRFFGGNIGILSNNVKYDDIKIVPPRLFNFGENPNQYIILRNSNLFTDNDLVLFTSKRKVFVFKNVNSLSSDILSSISLASYDILKQILVDGTYSSSYTPSDPDVFTDIRIRYIQSGIPYTTPALKNHYLNFYDTIEYKVYKLNNDPTVDNYLLTEISSGNTSRYNFTEGVDGLSTNEYAFAINLGELVEIQETSELAGITLQDNATYPSQVIDYNSFNTTYPDWGKIGYSQPYFEEEQIAGTYTEQWAAISVDTDTPTSQADSQAGEIDFTDTDLVDDIIDDIDNADDGNDEEEVDPNSDEIEGEGETPDDELDRIEPNVLTGGFIKQYALDKDQMKTLAECLTNPDLMQTVVRAFRDPMQAIVSLQLAYKLPSHSSSNSDIILYGFDWASLTNKPQGKMLATNIADFDFGTVHIDPLYNTYQDITTTSIELYLPCVGFIPLNPAEFLDRGLDVEGKIDTLSGTIVYDISAYDGTKRKLIYQKTGNCQLQLPISSNDNSTIFGALMGVGGMALGGFTGNPLLMAQGAAMTGASMVQGPNYEHGGSISANAGLMTKMIPCVIIKRNQVYNPTHLNELHGLPANSYVKLGSCSGYTVVQDVKVDIQGATQSEKSQIETLLKGGIIL